MFLTGGLGKTANYAVVMAELIVNGERKGPHPFMVQLRDEETHQTLPGITVTRFFFNIQLLNQLKSY
jgi:hypothetical protein